MPHESEKQYRRQEVGFIANSMKSELVEVENEVEAPPQLPLTDGRYFACRRCHRILSESQWYAQGCSECSPTMGIPDRLTLMDYATPHFHNFIGLIAPQKSWVARLIMKSNESTNGVFAEAISDDDIEEPVEGELYTDAEEEEEAVANTAPRDTAEQLPA